jgi:ribonuclease HII
VVKGDQRIAAISAASILAKVHRDALMCELNRRHPGYGFDCHFGYPTRAHLDSLARLGPCTCHRRTFAPVRLALQRGSET